MTSTPPPREPAPSEPARGPRMTPARVTTWIVVGGIGVFLLVSGIIGMIAKG